jgi:hypothetical protein
MSEAIRAPQLRNRLRAARFERLENREVLSADAGLGQLASAGHAAAAHFGDPTLGTQRLEISIVGTQVSYSPAGLPDDMKGIVYLESDAGTSSAAIGSYDETLTPIFAPVGAGGSLVFVGASGTCTFTFDLSFGQSERLLTVGSIVTSDVAYIEGALPDGTLLVGSNSSPITAGTGICYGLSGTFNGQSEVRMGATFYMHTTVDFTVTSSMGVNMQETLTALAAFNAGAGQDRQHEQHGNSQTTDFNSAAHAWLPRSDHLSDWHAAVDSAFANEAAPLGQSPLCWQAS